MNPLFGGKSKKNTFVFDFDRLLPGPIWIAQWLGRNFARVLMKHSKLYVYSVCDILARVGGRTFKI
jgi:hypothetical protein